MPYGKEKGYVRFRMLFLDTTMSADAKAAAYRASAKLAFEKLGAVKLIEIAEGDDIDGNLLLQKAGFKKVAEHKTPGGLGEASSFILYELNKP